MKTRQSPDARKAMKALGKVMDIQRDLHSAKLRGDLRGVQRLQRRLVDAQAEHRRLRLGG